MRLFEDLARSLTREREIVMTALITLYKSKAPHTLDDYAGETHMNETG